MTYSPNSKHQETFDLELIRSDRKVKGVLSFVHFDQFEAEVKKDKIKKILTKEELEYFNHLKFDKRRKNYLMGRKAGKLSCAKWLNEKKLNKINISIGTVQCPIVKHLSFDIPELTLSHAGNIAIAVAHEAGHVIGIDLEIKNLKRYKTYQREMSLREKNLVAKLTHPELASNILWTVKEALSKVIKCGIMISFRLLETSSCEKINEREYLCKFKNFAHLKSYSYVLEKYILSVVIPIKTELKLPIEKLREIDR